MNALDKDFAEGVWNKCQPPCLSLYQPTHRQYPESQQNPIRFRNLVKTLEEPLKQRVSKSDTNSLLKPFLSLADDPTFWNQTLDGLAILATREVFRVYVLQRPVPELALVADSFHIKPLLRILQSTDRYQILGVSRGEIKLFEGNRDSLDELEPARSVPRTMTEALGEELTEPHRTVASYGGVGRRREPMQHGHGGKESEIEIDEERFFRAVDKEVLKNHSKPSQLPLILAALPQHHHLFHKISRNPFLMKDSIDVYPDGKVLTIDELREHAWKIFEPTYTSRLDELVEKFGRARSKERGDDDLKSVAKAAVTGRVATLLIEAERQVPGRIDTETGEIESKELTHPEADDVLDDLGELVMKRGGEVMVVPPERMPTKTGVAAIYQY